MKLTIELTTHELTENVLGSVFQLAKQVAANETATGAVAAHVAKPAKVTPNVAPIAPVDSPDVGAPTTAADFTMLGFGSGNTPPPAGAVSVPSPAAPAPAAVAPPPPPPAAATAQVSGALLDSKGTPHSPDIHATPGSIVASSGEWRAKRGVDKTFASTQAEQLRRMAAASGNTNHAVQTAPETGGTTNLQQPPAPPAAIAPPPPPPAAAPATPPAPPAAPSAFARFMQAITPYMVGSGQPTAVLKDSDLTEIAAKLGLVDAQGVGQVSLLQSREELIPNFGEWINWKIGQINAANGAA